MTSKQLNKLYEKAKAEYLAEMQNDNGSYNCKGCWCNFMKIEIHHIIKRSKLKYYYADEANFIELCSHCHEATEDIIEVQEQLYCFDYMKIRKEQLLLNYNRLKPYEQTLLWKYGK